MNKRGLFLAVLATVAFAPSTLAKAPFNQYERFEASSATISDSRTKLTWTRVVARPPVPFTVAQGNCESPYRLPTMKELQTLLDEEPASLSQRRYLDADAFPAETSPVSEPYWTTTISNGSERFAISFLTGATSSRDPQVAAFYRCVTGPTP